MLNGANLFDDIQPLPKWAKQILGDNDLPCLPKGFVFDTLCEKNKQDQRNYIKYLLCAKKVKLEIKNLKKQKSKIYNKSIFFNEPFKTTLILFSIILIILYPIRFFIVLIKWSIKTLKTKENKVN